MSEYDRDLWEQRRSQALRTHGDRVAQRPPNAQLTADLATWTPPRDAYDLVVCLYVHAAGSVEELVQRGGGARRARSGRVGAIVAEERPRATAGTDVDAVIRARRR